MLNGMFFSLPSPPYLRKLTS